MPQYTIYAGNQATDLNCGSGCSVVNYGPNTVYYRDEFPVSVGTNDGVLSSGQATTLSGEQFFFVATGLANLTVNPSAITTASSVLDQSQLATTFLIPTTATTASTAVVVTNLTITPLCQAGTIRLSAIFQANHGSTGWAAGRAAVFYIGDSTGPISPPVHTGIQCQTNGQLTGGSAGVVCLPMSGDFGISASDAVTRTFSLYAYVTNAALSNAQVVQDPSFKGFIRCEQVFLG